MKTADPAAKGQLFARVPVGLMAEVEASASANYRNVQGEMLAALDWFVQADQDDLTEYPWRYETWHWKTDAQGVNLKAIPAELLERFRKIAARYKGDALAFAHALEFWVDQGPAGGKFEYASRERVS